jgi:hypothetical protein
VDVWASCGATVVVVVVVGAAVVVALVVVASSRLFDSLLPLCWLPIFHGFGWPFTEYTWTSGGPSFPRFDSGMKLPVAPPFCGLPPPKGLLSPYCPPKPPPLPPP